MEKQDSGPFKDPFTQECRYHFRADIMDLA